MKLNMRPSSGYVNNFGCFSNFPLNMPNSLTGRPRHLSYLIIGYFISFLWIHEVYLHYSFVGALSRGNLFGSGRFDLKFLSLSLWWLVIFFADPTDNMRHCSRMKRIHIHSCVACEVSICIPMLRHLFMCLLVFALLFTLINPYQRINYPADKIIKQFVKTNSS